MTLFKDHIQDHLTPSPVDTLARQSYSGMAHFAGTGPHLKTCRECLFWDHQPFSYRSKNGKYSGQIKPACCKKYQQITSQIGDAVPDEAAACKYFDENPTPPTRYAKG